MSKSRIDRIVSQFLQSEYFTSWQSEHVDAGAYSRDSDRRDRFDRCYDAAEHGADGSTHREHIADMRSAFGDYLRDRRRQSRARFAEFPYRLQDAADRHFARLEQWHENNGSIDQEVG
jgi:hypothetical protein